MAISKYLEHKSFFPPNATQFKHMNGCVINWIWSNNRRSEDNSGSWWQSEKNLHINVMELVTVSIEIKDFDLSNLCLLLETDENTRFAINKWRSPCIHIPTKCFNNSSGNVSSDESAYKSISNTKSLKCDCRFRFLSWGKAIAQEICP